MALARVVSEIFNVEKCRDLEIPNASMMGLPETRLVSRRLREVGYVRLRWLASTN